MSHSLEHVHSLDAVHTSLLWRFDTSVIPDVFSKAPLVGDPTSLRILMTMDKWSYPEHSVHALDNPHLTPEGAQILFDCWCFQVIRQEVQSEDFLILEKAFPKVQELGASISATLETFLTTLPPTYHTARLIELLNIPVPPALVYRYKETPLTGRAYLGMVRLACRLSPPDWEELCVPHIIADQAQDIVALLIKGRVPGALSHIVTQLAAVRAGTLALLSGLLTPSDWSVLVPLLSPETLVTTLEQMPPSNRATIPRTALVSAFQRAPELRSRAFSLLHTLGPTPTSPTP